MSSDEAPLLNPVGIAKSFEGAGCNTESNTIVTALLNASEAAKPVEDDGYNTKANTMVYDILSAKGGKDDNNKNACGHNLPRHGGGCTPDGCVYCVFVALSGVFRKTGLGWNAAELVNGNSDDHETRPITSSVTGGAASMIPLIPFDQDTTQNADSSGDCCGPRGCCDCSSSSCDPGCCICDANCAGGPC